MISRLTLCISSAVFNRTFFNTTPPQKGKSRVSPAFSFFFRYRLFFPKRWDFFAIRNFRKHINDEIDTYRTL